jgi:hypothetical protein
MGETTASNEQAGQFLSFLPQLGPDGKTVELSLGMKFTTRAAGADARSNPAN